jgi:Zn-dependent protease
MSREEPTWWKAPVVPEAGHPDPHEPPLYGEPPAYVEPPAYTGYTPAREDHPFRNLLRRIWAPIAALGAFLVKFGAILFKLKIFTTAGTMLVSIAAYSVVFGWQFAVGFVILLLVHELGHVIELRRQGVPASAPLFIPFLGAVVGMRGLPDDAWKEARVALAGPLLGSAGAAVCWVLANDFNSELLRALAFTGFFLNLFNLLPIVPLDGGRAVAALHPAIWLVGLVGLGALAYLHPNPILLVIIVLGVLELWRRWQMRRDPGARSYYAIPVWQRVVVGVVYAGLAVALAVAMTHTHVHKTF